MIYAHGNRGLMIILFEPQCRGFAHEQFNAGFLYGYLLAYPGETIVFFGEKKHIKCIQAIFKSAHLPLDRVEFVEMDIPEANRLGRISVIPQYYRIFKQILLYALGNNCRRIALLSVYSYNLIPFKLLIRNAYTDIFQFHIVLHGTLEFVKRRNVGIPFANLLIKLLDRTRDLLGLPDKEFSPTPTNRFLYEKLFKTSLRLFGNRNITYYVFREDTLAGVKKYLPGVHYRFKSIDLPYIFKDMTEKRGSPPSGKKVFAVLGQGNIAAIRKLIRKLGREGGLAADRCEFRIFGSSRKPLTDPAPINHIGGRHGLTRAEIEEQIGDVQYALFFYPPDSYELMTSGAFFDAIAYCKPMIFVRNHCFDFYHRNYNFGYRCENLEEMTTVIKGILNGDDRNYTEFCNALKRLQNDVSITRTHPVLKFEEGITS